MSNSKAPKIYKVSETETENFYMLKAAPFLDVLPVPSTPLDSDVDVVADSFLESWHSCSQITGAVVAGNDVGAKSEICNTVCNKAMSEGYPVLYVDGPLSISSIDKVTRVLGPCVVYIECFEKVFPNTETENELLTYFSDKSLGKVMFLVAADNERALPVKILDRPAQFLFKYTYNT